MPVLAAPYLPLVIYRLAALSSTPVYALMAFGFAVAVGGHVVRDMRIVAIGIAVLFVATALLLLGAYQDYQDRGPLI